ncbi:SLBB domain-containing protein [Thermocoleostomius sinensis]|uniref:SLBB domain-containing protein n=1 Tax=Thermocoleostomius sinensis A174 TaxID=2016057 RepID=A0A9E8ZGL2_9CYAN|nr:SLBB domain-containing protein [Thermocoleostomius sinensis]WAL62376.1 SLBB domain-containing protein [Thermocoleostomius sinensis A174]
MPSQGFLGSANRVVPFLGLALVLVTTTAPATAQPSNLPVFQGPIGSPPPQPDSSYRLGAGDRVRIDIFQVEQYSGENEVQLDGTLNLPLVGSVSVAGLTLSEATDLVSSRYSQFLRRPIVTVTLLNRRPLQIAISGEVIRPGSYAVSQQQGEQYPTLTQLLQTAGGITQSANVRQIQVRRTTTGEVFNVDLWEFLQTGDLRYDVTLRDGDTIVVPETTIALNEAPVLAASNFAPESGRPINIAVVGEVFRPGAYTVTGGTSNTQIAGETGNITIGSDSSLPTVTRAIQIAGGIKPLANIRDVEIRRLTRTGQEQVFKVNLWSLLQGDLRQDAILQEGDTVVIPTATAISPEEASTLGAASFSPDTIQVNVVGEVKNPGIVSLRPNSTLNQAILAAGGVTPRASRNSLDFIRLNPDGTVTRQELELELGDALATGNNPIVQNNDVIVVGRSGIARAGDTLETILAPLGNAFSIFEFPFRFLRLFR